MTARLGAVIDSILNIPGVVAALFVDSAGQGIEGASCAEGDLAAAARWAGQMLGQWAAIGTELRIGGVRSILIERSGGPVAIAAAPGGGAFLVAGDRSCPAGRVRREAGRASQLMIEFAAGAPGGDGLDEPASRAAGGPAEGRLTSGEVVLVGTHPFRLVTRLVARLLQAKGVRSSRLRAYSPDSTVIDVELENGGTLDAIAGKGFRDLRLEPEAESRTRLVLKAAKSTLGVPSAIGGSR